jgi:hypothetical protein
MKKLVIRAALFFGFVASAAMAQGTQYGGSQSQSNLYPDYQTPFQAVANAYGDGTCGEGDRTKCWLASMTWVPDGTDGDGEWELR